MIPEKPEPPPDVSWVTFEKVRDFPMTVFLLPWFIAAAVVFVALVTRDD